MSHTLFSRPQVINCSSWVDGTTGGKKRKAESDDPDGPKKKKSKKEAAKSGKGARIKGNSFPLLYSLISNTSDS